MREDGRTDGEGGRELQVSTKAEERDGRGMPEGRRPPPARPRARPRPHALTVLAQVCRGTDDASARNSPSKAAFQGHRLHQNKSGFTFLHCGDLYL